MPDNAAFCPGCGRRMWVPGQGAAVKQPSTTPAVRVPAAHVADEGKSAVVMLGHEDNFLAALAYLTFIPAVVFVLIAPLKRNRFVRFHSFQSIFLALATIVVAIAMRIVYSVLAFIPVIGFLLGWLALTMALLGWMILWLVLVIKALQGVTFKLPLIGSLAEKA